MHMFSQSSVALTNLISFVCQLIACDSVYEAPVSNNRVDRKLSVYENTGDDGANLLVHPNDDLEVVTKLGKVKGYYMANARGEQVIRAFEGLPYAEPPTGERRFKPPVPKKPWGNSTLLGYSRGPECLQLHYGRLKGEEGCLSLNIYSKNVRPAKPYPVIVFIHGGFFLSGDGSYGPAYLLIRDVILVTVNYRLGPLGFFTTGNEVVPGNNGLRDQALALDFVHSNIAAFGGDPSKITLVGNSAGSVSTHLLMISNHPSKNIIKRAISMSGTAYNIWALNKLETAKMVSMHLANVSGCPSYRQSHEVANCLRRVDASVLVANQLFTLQTGFFLPSIEPKIPGSKIPSFLTNTVDEAYANGNVLKVPWIATMTSREVNLALPALQSTVLVRLFRAAINSDLSSLLTFKREEVDEDTVRRKILQFYTGSESVNTLTHNAISQIATNRYFTVAIRKAVQMHSQIAPTYASIFNYTSELGRAGRRGLQNHRDFGSLHAEDLVYFLNSTSSHPPIRRYDSHFAITKLLVNLFSNFATYGNPLYETEDHEIYKIWDEIENRDRLRFLRIDEEVKMIDDPFVKVAKFWDGLGIPDITPSFRL